MAKRLCAVVLATSLVIAGCGSSKITVSGGVGGGTIGQLYVATPTSILRFSNAFTSNGNVGPTATITGAATGLSAVSRILLDSSANRLYVANQGTNSILIFEAVSTLNGNVAPNRSISGPATLLSAPTDIALDPANNLLYVASGTHILVYAAASSINGNSPPVRNINMGVTVGGLFLDATNNQLYVADTADNAIDRLDGASSQDVVGIVGGAIAGAATGLSSPSGLTLDASGRLIVSNAAAPLSLTIYASASFATGNVVPAATISGAATGLVLPGQLAFNKTVATGEVFVADSGAGSVFVFSNTNAATGNVAPTRAITGAGTGLVVNAVRGLALDTTR